MCQWLQLPKGSGALSLCVRRKMGVLLGTREARETSESCHGAGIPQVRCTARTGPSTDREGSGRIAHPCKTVAFIETCLPLRLHSKEPTCSVRVHAHGFGRGARPQPLAHAKLGLAERQLELRLLCGRKCTCARRLRVM